MLRSAVFTLPLVFILSGSLQAQRAGMTFQGKAAGMPVRAGFAGQRSFSNGFFPQRGFPNAVFPRPRFFPGRFHFRRDGVGAVLVPYFVPYYEPFGYEQPYAEAVAEGPAPVVIQQTPPAKPQIIEVPGVAGSTAAQRLPPTIFILTNGEQLENRRFVLSASSLSVSIDRHQRTIPLDMLDIDATIAANRERGIDLRIPTDRNEISLSF